jgi:hypothetical protein
VISSPHPPRAERRRALLLHLSLAQLRSAQPDVSHRPVALVMNAHSDSTPAGLFFRVATVPPDSDWTKSDAHLLDWHRLISLALIHNSITVLEDRIAALPSGSVPPEVRAHIGRLALVWTFKLRHLERRVEESVAALATAGIDVTLLKGAALAVTVYSEFVHRPMADVDLMVDPYDADKAHEILQTIGWIIETTSPAAELWRDHHHLPPLGDTTGSGLRLEIHTAPLLPGHPFRLTQREVLETARRIKLGATAARVPELHLHATHAAIHFGYSHQFTSGGLNFFRDLAVLTRAGDWSWERFVETAERTGAQSCCYWTLRLANALIGLPVPAEVLATLSPRLGDRVSSVLEEHFSQLVMRAEHSCPSVDLRHRLWAFALGVEEPIGRHKTWEPRLGIGGTSQGQSALRRFGWHLRRAPEWSRYVASLLGQALELTA